MPTKYWRVGGTNTWSSTANWSTVSPTGPTGAAIPVLGDDVVISNVGQTAGTINIGATATAKLNSWTVIGGTWTVAGATQVNVAGTFDCQNVTWSNTGLLSLQGSGGSYNINTSGTTFQCSITFNSGNTSGCAFNLLSALTTGVTRTITFNAGDLILGGNITTGQFTSGTGLARSISFSTYNIVLSHTTAATVVLNMSNATGFSWTGTGGFTVADMSNTRTFTFGPLGIDETNAVNLTFSTGASIATITTTSRYKSINFGTTSFALPSTTLSVYGNLTLSSSGTYTVLTLSMLGTGTGTITPNGKTIGPFTLNTTGTVTLAGALVTGAVTMTAGTINCATFNLGQSAGTTFTFSSGTISNMGTLTYTNFTITNGGTFTMTSGTLTCSNISVGTAAPLLGYFIYSGGSVSNISAAGVSLLHVRGDVTLNASLNLNGSSTAILNTYQHTGGTLILNNYNLTVGIYQSLNSTAASPATEIQFGSGFIYVGTTAAAQSCITITTVWNFTNTGTGGFSLNVNVSRSISVFTNVSSANASLTYPILEQAFNVFVTSGSSALTIVVNSRFRTLNFTGSSCTFVASGGSVYCQTLILGSAASYTGLPGLTGQLVMNGAGSITSNGKTLGKLNITQQYDTSAITTLNDALTCSDRITITGGVISSAYNITALYFLANTAANQELRSTNNIYLTLTGTSASAGASGVFGGISGGYLVISAGIVINLTAATAKNFLGGGATYPTLNNGGAGTLTITGSNTFDTLSNSVQPTGFSFTAGTTQTVTNFTLSGISGSLVTLTSGTPSTQYSLSKSSGTVSAAYLSIRDSNATGGASWYAGVNSTNVSNNTGWIFTAPPTATATGNFFLFF